MNLAIYDPRPAINDYLSPMYFDQMERYAKANGIELLRIGTLTEAANCVFICHADYLIAENVSILKNNGCKIVGFSITDSSSHPEHFWGSDLLKQIDLMFMLTGIQKVNIGHEMIMKPDFTIGLEERRFLPDADWEVFNSMRASGRLQSLPYAHLDRQPSVEARPYSTRNHQAFIRGGHHMRRFILMMKLMEIGKLDCNSGFFTAPYFMDSMNPQFRYCDECRVEWRKLGKYKTGNPTPSSCRNPVANPMDISDLSVWNNKCPQSFYSVASALGFSPSKIEHLFNVRWLTQQQHLEMLARITFTSDLKWLFSIYAAQRFWDAASVGCINLLPSRTADQEYFPKMEAGTHYEIFDEKMDGLVAESMITKDHYDNISRNAKALYEEWMKPSELAINTNLLRHIFQKIEEHTS
jgi:hypothetical protein